MPEKYTKVKALKAFAGAGVYVKKGDVVEFPNRWLQQYENRGLVARVDSDATYQTKVVEPRQKETLPSGGLSDNHPYLETETDEDVVPEKVDVDDDPPEYEMLEHKSNPEIDDLERRGPYYVLPNGKKVRGRENAELELAAYYGTEHESDN